MNRDSYLDRVDERSLEMKTEDSIVNETLGRGTRVLRRRRGNQLAAAGMVGKDVSRTTMDYTADSISTGRRYLPSPLELISTSSIGQIELP